MPHTDELNKKQEQENRQASNKPSKWVIYAVAFIMAVCIYLTYLIANID